MSKPSVILVPGGWHVPSHYASLVKELETHGYKCVTIELPTSQSPDDPPRTLTDDISAVRKAVTKEFEEGNNVVVCAHSYGGHAVNRALKNFDHKSRADSGFSTSVQAVAFLSALLVPPGPSLLDAMGVSEAPLFDRRDSEHYLWVGKPGAEFWFYNDLPEEEAKKWAGMLNVQSWLVMLQASPDAAYIHIPCGYLHCTRDNAVPLEQQQMMVEIGKAAGARIEYTETVESGHSPFLSMPKRTAEFIRRVAGEDVEKSA